MATKSRSRVARGKKLHAMMVRRLGGAKKYRAWMLKNLKKAQAAKARKAKRKTAKRRAVKRPIRRIRRRTTRRSRR